MGNLLNSDDGLINKCCAFTDETDFDHKEETYSIALKQDMQKDKDKGMKHVVRAQTPFRKPIRANEEEIDSEPSLSLNDSI